MDTNRLRELLDQRDDIDREIHSLVAGTAVTPNVKRAVTCSLCGETGHTARVCPQKGPRLIPSQLPDHPNGAVE